MNFEEFFQTQLDQGKYGTSNIGQRALEEGWIGCKNEVLKILDEQIFYDAGTNVVIKINPLKIKREIEKL